MEVTADAVMAAGEDTAAATVATADAVMAADEDTAADAAATAADVVAMEATADAVVTVTVSLLSLARIRAKEQVARGSKPEDWQRISLFFNQPIYTGTFSCIPYASKPHYPL